MTSKVLSPYLVNWSWFTWTCWHQIYSDIRFLSPAPVCRRSRDSLSYPGHSRWELPSGRTLPQAVIRPCGFLVTAIYLTLAFPFPKHVSARINSGIAPDFWALCPVKPQPVHVFILFWSVFQPWDLKLLILFHGWPAEGFFKSLYILGRFVIKQQTCWIFQKYKLSCRDKEE